MTRHSPTDSAVAVGDTAESRSGATAAPPRRAHRSDIELRTSKTSDGKLRVSGQAIVFNKWSDVGPFMERILPTALDDAEGLDDRLLLLWSHDSATPLARIGAGLTIQKTATGLNFDAVLANTGAARDVHELVRSGVSKGCSFAFSLPALGAGERSEWREGREWVTVTKIRRVYELTLTPIPAYPTTSATARKKESTMPTKPKPAGGRSLLAEAAQRKADRERYKPIPDAGVTVRERSPYGADSPHSFFHDEISAQLRHDATSSERLERHRAAPAEKRAIVSGTLGGVVHNTPLWISEAIAAAARSQAPLAEALEQIPLPAEGVTVPWSQFGTGSTVTNQTGENVALTASADPAVAIVTDPVATVASYIDYSFQADDRSGGFFDAQIAGDLGSAFGARLEAQLWIGTGANQQVKGFAVATPGVSTTVGAQTLTAALPKIWSCWMQLARLLGSPPDLIAMTPERYAWLWAALDASNLQVKPTLPPCDIVASPAGPVTLGAGTEDWIVFANRMSVPLAVNSPTFAVEKMPNTGATSLAAKLVIHGYVALGTAKRPEGWGLVKGLTTVAL